MVQRQYSTLKWKEQAQVQSLDMDEERNSDQAARNIYKTSVLND